LIGKCAEKLKGAQAKALQDAYEQVEDQETSTCTTPRAGVRELWIQSLGNESDPAATGRAQTRDHGYRRRQGQNKRASARGNVIP
jgi:hypothetical protein